MCTGTSIWKAAGRGPLKVMIPNPLTGAPCTYSLEKFVHTRTVGTFKEDVHTYTAGDRELSYDLLTA